MTPFMTISAFRTGCSIASTVTILFILRAMLDIRRNYAELSPTNALGGGTEVTRSICEKTSYKVGIVGLARIWSQTKARFELIATKVHIMKNLSHCAKSSTTVLSTGKRALNLALIEDI